MIPLYDEAMEDCVLLVEKHTPDGSGGTVTAWEDGASFRAAVVLDTSDGIVAGDAARVHNVYHVYVDPADAPAYHTVFRRVSDGRVFRVTQEGKTAPARASFRLSVCMAEGWEVPA